MKNENPGRVTTATITAKTPPPLTQEFASLSGVLRHLDIAIERLTEAANENETFKGIVLSTLRSTLRVAPINELRSHRSQMLRLFKAMSFAQRLELSSYCDELEAQQWTFWSETLTAIYPS
jgi:hypothetical protein